ncbi:MAG: hypothetical protein ACJAYU_004792 [Bradymonadia bacterium]|jgi:hypothetical protein
MQTPASYEQMAEYARMALPASPFGQLAYGLGRQAGDGPIGLEHIMFDADEVLWDWVMTTSDIVRGIPKLLRSGDLGHREYIRVKPGILEFLCGFRDARRARGADEFLRIWTNAYPWRVRAICERLPDLAQLLGGDTDSGIWEHPRLFTRPHYADLMSEVFASGRVDNFLASLAPNPRAMVRSHLEESPADTTLKLPDLAVHAAKSGFGSVRVLVDDRRRNVERFAASDSDRVGLWVANPPHPSVHRRLPNVTRGAATPYLEHQSRSFVRALFDALTAPPASGLHRIAAAERARDYRATEFTIEIPDDVLRAQWTSPPKRLKRRARGHSQERRR